LATKENTYCNGENRLFYLSDDVDNSSIGQLCWSLISQLQEDDNKEEKEKNFTREPIKIYINSYGGSVYDMWALIDIMLNSKTPIHTYCTGYAMSAAFKIFLAGHKRFATKHATFMYHQMSCKRHGKYQDLVEDREQMDYLQKSIEEYVVERTNLTQADMDDIRERKKDFYIHSKDAVKWGIVDEVI
jgi:ATP-dependent Clp protease protease subunit